MAEIIVKSTDPEKALVMLKDAIAKKIALLEYSLEKYRQRLENFEKKYNITSEQFINEWAAEDLEGKDIEYVEWAGEYKLSLVVEENLKILKSLEYVTQ
ncbi:MAG TPA: hypothetical protein DDW76_33095 [Cyanobacteria bacterium UBA11369]|nr:hypothetical protein [Cyanobacteria bacterium UBA11371]HBE33405.1 hypothetical protein [Cyanobacteria bacterium UBA11368]HBE53458.1 hypothetical protein [Cyanobacteria bacterium UBA11369]